MIGGAEPVDIPAAPAPTTATDLIRASLAAIAL